MKLRVMIVEDDYHTREALLQYMALLDNCETVAVADVLSAKAATPAFKPDLILTDYNMPGSNGLELIKEIKQIMPHVSVVLMSAYGEINTVVAAMRLGAEDFISKPFDLKQIDRIIANCYQRKNCIKSLDQIEAQYIESAIAQCGSVSAAAERLGINPSTIWRKRKKAS